MSKTYYDMPTAAIILSLVLMTSLVGTSYALIDHDLQLPQADYMPPSSGIFDIPIQATMPFDVKRYVIFGGGGVPDSISAVYRASSFNGFFAIALISEKEVPKLQSDGYYIVEDFELDFHDAPDGSRIGAITGSDFVHDEFGYTGDGVTVAIVDTGVDFSNLDLRSSLLRDDQNHPVMLDPDGQGIILTNNTFYAAIDDDGLLLDTKSIPEEAISSVYKNRDGIFLDIAQGGNGTEISIYNSFFPQAGESAVFHAKLTEDIKIGNDSHDYIVSKSGYYHLGMMYQGALQGSFARLQVVPVLVVDANLPGVYDTVIPDLSTSWQDYTRYDLPDGQQPQYDFDFTDEKPIVLGSGNEFLVYDSDDDGRIDYSAGTIGARVLDVYGVIENKTSAVEPHVLAVNGTLLYPIDPAGNYFGVMTDFEGHGTASAASVVSKGVNQYDIYNDTKKYSITAVAPGAKILPIKSLWFGDVVYSWLWAAGFENEKQNWEFTGEPRADIISNSWGISNFPNIQYAPGLDVISLILTVLSTPHSLDDDYPGVVMVVSAGNSGPGYGTIGYPNLAPFAISVGATTNNVFVGYGPFSGEPRFGNTTDHLNHVVDFSSRGPGIIGDPKPDIMGTGAHGFVPSTMLKLEKNSDAESFSLFGGTSMAGPIVAASAAVLMESMRDHQQEYDPFLIKNLLMSTATDIHNDAFTQGSGLVNLKNAVKFVKGKDVFLVYNDASYSNIQNILNMPIENINSTILNLDRFQLSHKNFNMMSWFGGHLSSGQRSTATFTVENPTNDTLEVAIYSQKLDLIKQSSYSGITKPKLQDRNLNAEDTYRPNYIALSDVKNFTDLGSFFDKTNPIPSDSELMILTLHFPFETFMNKTNDIYAEDLQISSLYLYDWQDHNDDTRVTSDELSMVSRGGSWGTVQQLRTSDPSTKFEGTPLVGIYPVPTKFSFWIADSGIDAVPMNYTLTASYYKKDTWEPVWIGDDSIIVPPKSSGQIDATIVVPHDYETGVYNGFLKFSSTAHDVNVPVSFVVTETITDDYTVLFSGKGSNDILYHPGFIGGAFDMTSRYMAGDWRQYYFDIQNSNLNTAAIEISWEQDDTSLAVFAIDPEGRIVQSNVPSGVFGHFMGWPSIDWLGTSPFSQGGGFFPVTNKDDTSTVLYVPLNQTGTYSLLVHSTLFGGKSITDPITLSAKFTTITDKDLPPTINLSVPDYIHDDTLIYPNITDNNLSSVKFFANDIEIFVKDDRLDFDPLPNDNYTMTVTALDEAGNYTVEHFMFVKNFTNHTYEKIQNNTSLQDDTKKVSPDLQNDSKVTIPDTYQDNFDPAIIIVPTVIALGIVIAVLIKLGNSSKK